MSNMSKQKILKEYISAVISELKIDRDMIDLFTNMSPKHSIVKFNKSDALNALHSWMLATSLIKPHGTDAVLDLSKISELEYEALKSYVVPRYQGLIRQYRRSKNPVESALSALPYYIANYYNSQIVSGKLMRRFGKAAITKREPIESTSGESHDYSTDI